MAWSLVGTTSAIITAGAGNQTVTLPGTVASGDLVLVATAADVSCQNCIATSGYTVPENTTGANPGANFGYKVISSDTSVDIVRNATILRAVAVQVWRGNAAAANVLDAAYTTPVTGTSANPDSGAITTTSVNALVVTIAYLDDDDSTVSVTPSTFNNLEEGNTGQASTTVGATIALASVIKAAAGALDPAAWTLSSTDAWSASSISFRPAAFETPVLTENVEVSDSASAAMPANEIEASISENLKIDDIGQGATQLVGAIKVRDIVTVLLDPLEATPGESVKVSDSATGAFDFNVAPSESIKVTDTPTLTLDPEQTSLSESVKVTDTVTAERQEGAGDLAASIQEQIKVDDIGQGATQLVGSLKVQDGPIVAVMEQPGTLSASLTESIEVADAHDSWAELSKDEYIKVSDQITATLTPLETSQQEHVKVQDTLTVDPFGINATPTESVRVSDVISVLLNPLQATPQEQVRVSDSPSLTLNPLNTSLQESIEVTDSASGSFDREVVVGSESVKVSDTVSAQLATLLVSLSESIEVSDSAQGSLVDQGTLNTSIQEAVRVSDSVQAQPDLLQVSLAESIRVTDSAFAIVGAGAFIEEPIEVLDTVVAALSHLEATLSEHITVVDVVDLNPATADYVIHVRPRVGNIHVRPRVATIHVKP